MRNLSLIFALFLCCTTWSIAQDLHKKANLDQLKSYDSKSSLAPAEMKKARETMLAIMNEGRANPNYRKLSGCKGDLNLPSGLVPLALDDRLNTMAQEQADYMAANDILTHDNKNYKDFGARVNKHIGDNYGPEGCSKSTTLAEYPIGFMTSETHYREVWNLGALPTTTVGFGIAKSKSGYWYIAAVWGNFPVNNNTTKPTNTTDVCDAKNAAKKYQNAMSPGQRLGEKEKLVSSNNRYHFRITSEGNFVIEEVQDLNNCRLTEVYRFKLENSAKPATAFFSYNDDGNLCMDGKSGGYCLTNGLDAMTAVIIYKSTKLELTDDGRLRLVNKSGEEIWASKPAPSNNVTACEITTKYKGFMTPSQRLGEKEKLVSSNNRYHFRITSEGNFVIEEVQDLNSCRLNEVYRFKLENSAKPATAFFSYNDDGNLCMDGKSGGYCLTNGLDAMTAVIIHKSTKLELTDDGRLRLVNKSGEEIWASKPAPSNNATACGITTKYQGFMTPGSLMLENEALVSANGRYQFRNNGGGYIIEEVLNRNNCQFKQVYNFTLVVTLNPNATHFNGGKRGFSYTKEGDIFYIPNMSLGVFSENPKNPSTHRDSPKVNVVGKSTKLELTNEGILRLVNNSGQVIWTTTGHDSK